VLRLSKYAFLLLTKKKWWNRRVAQRGAGKQIQAFVRKNAVGPTNTSLLLFYVTHPIREIRGTADFEERVVGKAEELWRDYSKETVFKSHDEYLDFMRGRTKTTFIRFRNLYELHQPIPLKKILQIIGISRLPRSGKYLSKEAVNKLLGGHR
jgi:predicted transcriptional regulator